MSDRKTLAVKLGSRETLAIALLLLIVGTHYGYAPLAVAFDDTDAAARALFYIFRGIEGTALFALIGLMSQHPAVMAVCLWGAVEESQTAVCRLGAGIDSDASAIGLFAGLCGPGWYWGGVVIAAMFAVWVAYRGARQ